jgi:HEAT repeat protein
MRPDVLTDLAWLGRPCRVVLALCMASLLAAGASRSAAAEADDPLVAMVVGLLGDADKDVRSLGLEQVRTAAPGEVATRQFAAQLAALPPEAQVGLLGALADRGDAAARTSVLETLADSEGDVRVASIEALGALGETADVPLLCKFLAGEEGAERAAARGSLVRLTGDGVIAAIIAQMKDEPAPIHAALIGILAERHAVEVVPTLLADAIWTDADVRVAAMAALGELGEQKHVAGMVAGVLFAAPGKEREAAERAVVAVCLREKDPQRRAEPLLTAFEALDAADRPALLSTLGRVGGDEALKIIEAVIGDGDASRHQLGIQALCNWPDATVAPRLIELATTDEHPPHRTTALRALIRIAPLPDGREDIEKLKLLNQAMEMCTRDEERHLVLKRASAVRIPETLAFAVSYVDKPAYAQQACETIVELAHHRALREANKAAFDQALDQVIAISRDAVVVERAQRYKQGQTWVRPKPQ